MFSLAVKLTLALGLLLGPAGMEPAKGADPPAKTAPAPYVLAPEDGLSISVINVPSLSAQVVVPPDGKISVPLLEPFSVLGMTIDEVKQTLTEKWRKYVVNPAVTVSLTQKRKDSILFYGFVARVGTLEFRPGVRLLAALAEVGGAQPQGDLSHVTLTRRSGEKRTLDLSHPETKGGTDADIPLEAGDVVYVPERRTQVTVLGEVSRPSSIDYKEEMTVLDALTAVGSLKETADRAAATLTRNGKVLPLNLEALLTRGDMRANLKLQAGDTLLVPEIHNRMYVFGAVTRPGYYVFKPGDRILDALNASGPTREADLARVNILHMDREKNTTRVEQVNLEKFLKKGDLKYNLALGPGDVVFIPDKRRGFQLQDLFGLLTGINLIDGVARLFSGGLGR
ncbi:MAG TPA: SLBB domain-containing protein [Chthonomonadaceae bacterium]|nr:SLBB domain-containing protein [Chthonomonadaceae bacterium]